MRSPVQRNYAAMRRTGRAASRKSLPYSIVQPRAEELCRYAAHGAHGVGKMPALSD